MTGPGYRKASPLKGMALTVVAHMRMTMRSFDLAPLYRATVGFDQTRRPRWTALLTQDVRHHQLPALQHREARRRLLAHLDRRRRLLGSDELSAEVRENALIVTARKADDTTERKFLHRGIATRAFERRFHLADHVRVTGASHVDGMLHIDLVKEVPEALKPRRIEIAKSAAQDANLVEAKAVN